jgi:adenine-specific DNA-methyltransferase
MVEPPLGTCWRYTRERFDELVEDGRIWFGLDGNGVPTVKKFLAEVQAGLVPTALWTHDEVGTSGTAKAEVQALFPETTPFSTPKPEALLERLIQVNSDVGDLVVDVFAGSGTTAAVAHKMGRRWVTTERESATVTTFTLPRLRMVAAGQDPGGATQTAGWTGGGGFRVAKMASSIFAVHDGRVLLSREATNGVFAEGVRAQLGFTTLDEPPFSGRKGRMLLAVVDGVVDENAIQVLVAKADGAAMTVVAKAHTDGAPILLKELSSHSILRKAPTGLLRRRVRGAGR